MLRYFSADITCSENRTVFRERSSQNTVSFEEQIIIPWARVGYEMVNSQRGPQGRAGYNQSHIQQARME